MMRIFFKKLPAAFSAFVLLLIAYTIAVACAGGDWDSSDSSSFAPETCVDSSYTPFFYSDMFYYSINYDDMHDVRFSDENASDWAHFMDAKNPPKKFADYVLNAASKQQVAKLAAYFAQPSGAMPSVPDSALDDRQLLQRKSTEMSTFLQYAVLAKQSEDFALNHITNSWDVEDSKPSPAAQKPAGLEPRLASALQSSTTDFVKERYWFQLVRYYFFYDDAKAVQTFEQSGAAFPKNTMYYRTMAYAAGALHRQKNFAKADYYYSLVFAGSDKLKTVAHWSFHPQEEADWKATLALCKSNDERATLWQMLGIFYADEFRSLREIYLLDPASSKMDVLLSRLVNEFENKDYGRGDSAKNTLPGIVSWVQQKAGEGKVGNHFLWHVSAGYLSFLDNQFAAAEADYNKADAVRPGTKLAAQQMRMLHLMAKTGALKTITAADENTLLPELKWLFDLSEKTAAPALRYTNTVSWVKAMLAKKYAAQHDVAKAECYVHNVNYFADPQNVAAILHYLEAPGTGYDQLCKTQCAETPKDIYEFQGILAAYKNDLAAAVGLLKKAADTSTLPANPFNGNILDCHDCEQAAPQKTKYSKLSLVQKLQEMEANVTAGKDVYNNALLVANAFYNITHFGNDRAFYECRIISDAATPPELDSVFRPVLTNNNISAEYYQLALQHAANDEQKAKALYLLARCERNQWYVRKYLTAKTKDGYYSWGDPADKTDFIVWNSFKAMKAYSNTRYYQEVLKECGYFAKSAGR